MKSYFQDVIFKHKLFYIYTIVLKSNAIYKSHILERGKKIYFYLKSVTYKNVNYYSYYSNTH